MSGGAQQMDDKVWGCSERLWEKGEEERIVERKPAENIAGRDAAGGGG